MNDLILLISVSLATYLGSMGFTIVLLRLFFPFKTKEEMERDSIVESLAKVQNVPGRSIVSMPILNKSSQLA